MATLVYKGYKKPYTKLFGINGLIIVFFETGKGVILSVDYGTYLQGPTDST